MRFFVMMQSKYAKLAIFTFSRWTYSMMHNGADLHCCTFCTLGIFALMLWHLKQDFREWFTCMSVLDTVVRVQWIDRLVLVLLPQLCCLCCVLCCAVCCACAAPGPQRATRAYFTWGVKNPHRKGHFANYWTYNCFGRSCFELWNLLNQPTPPSLNNLFVEYIRIRTFAGLYLTFPSGDGR